LGKTLVIGNATGYDWNKVKYWVNSLKKTGFAGDIALCVSNIEASTIKKFEEEGIITFAYGTQREDGSYHVPNGSAPHVVRFFYMWLVLDRLSAYDYVIATDVRDVIFQRDPSIELPSDKHLIVSSEGMKYKDEPWGYKNLLDAYGPFFQNALKDKEIYNVGVVAGRYESVKNLFLNVFLMSINRPIPIVDQASFNVIIHQMHRQDELLIDPPGWAIQLGTTPHAILEGTSGDLAYLVQTGKITPDEYLITYHGPLFYDYGGRLTNIKTNEEFTIVHQWDRIPSLKDAITVLYGA